MISSGHLAIYYPHTAEGSLGSFRRIKEISETLITLGGDDICIYSPFESVPFVKEGLSFCPIPMRGNSKKVYSTSKVAYYNPHFSKTLLPSALSFFGSMSAKGFQKALQARLPAAIQAELDVSLPAAVKAGKALNLPVIADIHNITPEELVASRALSHGSWAYDKMQSMIAGYLAECELVVVVSESMKEYVVEKYRLDMDSVMVVPPAGKPDLPIIPSHHARVVYAGMISYREKVDLFINAIRYVKADGNPSFYMTAKGDRLEKRFGEEQLSSIHRFWFPAEKDFFSFLASCTVGILTSSSDLARRIGVPIKMFDYMSVGLPF
ncbi:MAG: glycosyltransferase, partial [Candidatus Methanomethylicus sp.]|nr:glycosyltransferase [Candidatus Methanomethylicus sp.]